MKRQAVLTLIAGGRQETRLHMPAADGALEPEIASIIQALARQGAREEYRRLTAEAADQAKKG